MPSDRGTGSAGPLSAEGQHSLDEIMADFARLERRAQAAGRTACEQAVAPGEQPWRAQAAGLTRRDFLQAAAVGAAVGAMASAGLAAELPAGAATGSSGKAAAPSPTKSPAVATPVAAAATPPAARSRVIVVTHPEVILKDYRVNPPTIRQMIDRAMVELTGKATPAEAWAAIGRADDVFAIKHNSIGRPTLESHAEINEAVAAQLVAAAKVDVKSIFIVDRDIPAPLNELSEPFTLPTRSLQTRLRRLYTDKATAIVNVSVLKSHYDTGMSAALKNHLGSVNNPAAFHGWEKDHLPRSLPELSALPPIRTKTRLVIIDAIKPLFAGGPADDPQYRWDYKSLIVSTDPVAASAVGMRILEEKRAAFRGKEWPMTAARDMFAYAQSIGLGNADADRIDLVRANMA
jgi:hypothetical protein